MKTNTFYKPKNEFGDELASKKLLSASIDSLEKKHNDELLNLDIKLSNQISNLDTKFDGEITSLETRPTFNFKIASPEVKIEEYIQQRWSECTTIEEREALKIEIGQTIYLRNTGAGVEGEYEEYICTNPSDIDTSKSVVSADITYNRLGAVQAILGGLERPGSVRLRHNLYDQSAEEWNELVTEETVYGIKNGNHLPKEGLAVAPCALYKFVQEDKRIEGDLKNLADEVKHISEEILGVKDDAQTGLQNSRLDAHDEEIANIKAKDIEQDEKLNKQNTSLEEHQTSIEEIKNVIGMAGCCTNCNEEECTCGDCNASLDCSIICKIKSMDEAITSNSDELARVDSEVVRIETEIINKELRPAIEANSISIDNINNAIGTKRDTNKEESIIGGLNELDARVSQNTKDISANAIDIANVSQDVTTLRTDSFKEIGNHPEGAEYANTSLWHKIEEFDDEFNRTNEAISTNVKRIDEAIHSLEETVGSSTDNSSETSATLHGKTNYLLGEVRRNTTSISSLETIVGTVGDSKETDTLCGKVKQIANDLETTKADLEDKDKELDSKFDTLIGNDGQMADDNGSVKQRIKFNKKSIDELNLKVETNSAYIEDISSEDIPRLEKGIADNNTAIGENSSKIKDIDTLIGSLDSSDPNQNGTTLCARIKGNTEAINENNAKNLEQDARLDVINKTINDDNGIIATLNEHTDALKDHASQIENIETIANEAKTTAEEIFAAHHVFNSLIVECDLPGEDFEVEGVEAKIAIHYSDICDIIKENTGVTILPGHLSIIFNGARFTVDDGTTVAEQFYPEVTYEGVVDADNNAHRALVLKFAGYPETRHVLISLTYYDNTVAQPSKINFIRIN
jgi:hypothetical protein